MEFGFVHNEQRPVGSVSGGEQHNEFAKPVAFLTEQGVARRSNPDAGIEKARPFMKFDVAAQCAPNKSSDAERDLRLLSQCKKVIGDTPCGGT